MTKSCEWSEVVSYLQASKLVCQFHGCWQKIIMLYNIASKDFF